MKNLCQRITSLLLVALLAISLLPAAVAEAGTVSGVFTLVGDKPHLDGAHVDYVTWMDKVPYTADKGATVMDVFKQVLDAAGYTYHIEESAYGDYLTSVTTPQGQTVEAADWNGGWTYGVNGKMGAVSAGEYVVADGDHVQWLFTDDFSSDSRIVDYTDIVLDPPAQPVERPQGIAAWWPSFRGAGNAALDVAAPQTPDDAAAKWVADLKDPADWYTGLSNPLIVGDEIFIIIGDKLTALDADGQIVRQGDLAAKITYYAYITYDDGAIYVPHTDGRLQALAVDTLQTLWVTDAPAPYNEMEHQALSVPLAADGKVYYATACADWTSSYYGVIRCVDAATGAVKWEYANQNAGYYWSGALMMDGALVIAGDDGILLALDAATGDELSRLDFGARVRSGLVALEDGTAVVADGAGTLHRIAFANGRLSETGKVAFAAASTSTPAVYQGKAYVGGNNADYTGVVARIDLDTMAVDKTVSAPAAVQASPLVCDNGDSVAVYFTANTTPGGLYVWRADEDAARELFVPEGEGQNYCMTSAIVDEDGTLYYTNDSGKLFAIQNVKQPAEPTEPAQTDDTDATKPEATDEPTATGPAATDAAQPTPPTGEETPLTAVCLMIAAVAAIALAAKKRIAAQ
ncbi:MAG: PQQ-binding-like beta-propeller repeat protein [Acutalibacteraceae bacterium]|jgi:outer membrane protein assembly factor BamB